MNSLITVEQALELLKVHIGILDTEVREINDSLGYVLSKDVYSPINMPPFRQSAMDGYALNSGKKDQLEFEVIAEVPAGITDPNYALPQGKAVRIFTGAAVPKNATTVVPQEFVRKVEGKIKLEEAIPIGANIRPVGEQIKSDDIALARGVKVTPAVVGFLSGLGVTKLEVYRHPKISIIATGNELVEPGRELPYGSVYESNSIMLAKALDSFGFNDYETHKVRDNYLQTKTLIESQLHVADVLLLSGGISVGDYDYVGKALNELGVNQVFYKVRQKPGKPLYFGTYSGKYVLALPGNPAAALTCFYVYALELLKKMSGAPEGLRRRKVKLNQDYAKKGDRAQFLKAKLHGDSVEILGSQNSSMLNTFAVAEALVYVPSDVNFMQKGTFVEAYIIEQYG